MGNNFEAMKKKVGQKVFTTFENLVVQNEKLRDEQFQQSTLEHAAKLAEDKPFVTLAFRDNGILTGSHTEIISVFRPNLWAQDHAYSQGKLSQMNVFTAAERGIASGQFAYENYQGLRELLKRRGKSESDFMMSMMRSALIEAAYYSRIGGLRMDKEIERLIDIAIMKRYIKKESMFRTLMGRVGIDPEDVKDTEALVQIAEKLDLVSCLKEISETDPYFIRRSDILDEYRNAAKMDAENSVKLASLQSDAFTRELFSRILKRKHAEPWLVKAVMELFQDNAA
ncbi:hypothetical protein ABE354_24075 [Brevibacillus laterosporus]|uniref:hypothetical protein n=1 Tax=Brevibacillus laterosporus TaxID=1465 RepID=UPI003D2083F6